MVVGEVASATEVLVVGGGPGGYAAALRVRQEGRRVTLVERGAIGGVCLNVGCIPSKVLIHAAGLASMAGHAGGFGVELEARADLVAIRAAIDEAVADLTGGVDALLTRAGVERVAGVARFSRPDRVVVDDGDQVRHFEFEEAIVATGSRPLGVPGLDRDGDRVIDSTGALALTVLPRSLAVVGGGYIGVELGTAFAKLGVEVTMIEVCERLLPLMQPFQGAAVKRTLEALGARVVLGARARELSESGLRVESAAGLEEVRAEKVLVAVGRVPNTDDLRLEITRAELDSDGRIVVDAGRRAAPRILAVGDVTPGPALAHKATAEAEVAARTACGRLARFDPLAIPEVVFADPEIASVGLSLEQAREEMGEATAVRLPLATSGRARTLAATHGVVELVAGDDGSVLGIHMAGPQVSELAGEAALAIEMGATVEDVARTVHPHPTMSESIAEAAWSALGRPLHGRSR